MRGSPSHLDRIKKIRERDKWQVGRRGGKGKEVSLGGSKLVGREGKRREKNREKKRKMEIK